MASKARNPTLSLFVLLLGVSMSLSGIAVARSVPDLVGQTSQATEGQARTLYEEAFGKPTRGPSMLSGGQSSAPAASTEFSLRQEPAFSFAPSSQELVVA